MIPMKRLPFFIISLAIVHAVASPPHANTFSNLSLPSYNHNQRTPGTISASTHQSSTTETFPVCDVDFASEAIQNWKDCESCSNAVEQYILWGQKPPSGSCSECCATLFLDSATFHFLRCKNGCCYRLVTLQVVPGLTPDQVAFVQLSQGFAVNGVKFVGKSNIGSCEVEAGPSDDSRCGPRCAIQLGASNVCAGKKTAEIPKWGEDLLSPPCAPRSPEEATETNPPSDDSSSDPKCFPGDGAVSLSDGELIQMINLRPGQRVYVGNGQYSEVIGLTHDDAHAVSEHVHLSLESGNNLTLTKGHYIYSNEKLIPARNVAVGDVVRLGDGRSAVVIRVAPIFAKGLFSPQTAHGDIVVNGVVVSTYTEAVDPQVAHALLVPFRALAAIPAVRGMLSRVACVLRALLSHVSVTQGSFGFLGTVLPVFKII